ncbi:MAG: RluA family pseudouridine synthase [Bacteroidetes bacterium]|nr:RluA family pseudouridine synthase [Bacteroidota bacterium]
MAENSFIVVLQQRLDVCLAQVEVIGSRSQAQKLIQGGHVTVDDKVIVRSSHQVFPDAIISWKFPLEKPLNLIPQDLPIDIVYEDECLMVINKPSKMPVHPGAGRPTGTLVNALLYHVGSALPYPKDAPFRPGIVHRLDMDTTGLLVVTKNESAHRALQKQFESRSVKRQYVGIVWGTPDPRSDTIDAPIGRSSKNRVLMTVRPDGRSAVTHYETHEILGAASLMRFQLSTGRTHQIRVHLHYVGHPLLGDADYGGASIRWGPVTRNRKVFYKNIFDVLNRQALHARSLGFIHPMTGKFMEFTEEMPEDMIWTVEQLQKDTAYFQYS